MTPASARRRGLLVIEAQTSISSCGVCREGVACEFERAAGCLPVGECGATASSLKSRPPLTGHKSGFGALGIAIGISCPTPESRRARVHPVLVYPRGTHEAEATREVDWSLVGPD